MSPNASPPRSAPSAEVTYGDVLNAMLDNYSIITIIVCGIDYNDELIKLSIACNAIAFLHPSTSAAYKRVYEEWMQTAVPDFCKRVDALPAPIFERTNVLDELHFDTEVSGRVDGRSVTKTARVRVSTTPVFQFILDTVFHDGGSF